MQHTGLVDADAVLRFARLARYWDLLANSGRFCGTVSLALHQAPGASPFWRLWALADALWQRLHATHRLAPEVLVDALYEVLAQSLPPDEVRQTLLADYIASGARSNPRALKGLLPRPVAGGPNAMPTPSARQQRHQNAMLSVSM